MGDGGRLGLHVAVHLPKRHTDRQGLHKGFCLWVERLAGQAGIVAQKGDGFFRGKGANGVFLSPAEDADALQRKGNIGIQAMLAAPGRAAGQHTFGH